MQSASVHLSLCWLLRVPILLHLDLQLQQNVFNSHRCAVPVREGWVTGQVNTSVRTHRWQVHLRVELNRGCLGWIVIVANDRQEVDASVEPGVGRADNGAIPVGEGLIVGVIEAVGAGRISSSVLTLLKFVKQFESSRF